MERLTIRSENKIYLTKPFRSFNDILRPLAELEDKLESGQLVDLGIGINIDKLKAIIRKETLEEVFTDMYKLVEAKEKHCDITISGADIKAIAKRYGVEVKE